MAEEKKKLTTNKSRKKAKRSVPAGQVHIQATFNNTIITVASEKAVSEAKQKYGLARVDVLVKGVGLGRESAIRALQNAEVMIDSIKDITPIAHGGVRPRKPRRG